MTRIPHANPGDELTPLVKRIIAERGELLDLYRMLLHSPPVAEGWLKLMSAIRSQTQLPGALRELVIIRIGLLNGATYEAEQHRPIALREGATQEQVASLADWQSARDLFDEKERAALALADQMTRQVQVDDEVWSPVRALWSEREIVELVATIASYNMVSRFLEPLEIHASERDS